MKKVLVAIVLCCVFSGVSLAEPNIDVKMDINTNNDTEKQVKSYISHALRELGDVTLTDTKPVRSIEIVAMKVTMGDNIHTGYALSVIYSKPVNLFEMWVYLNEADVGERIFKGIFDILTNINKMEHTSHKLYLCGKDEITKICQQIVAEFDNDELEPIREIGRRLEGLKATEPNEPNQ